MSFFRLNQDTGSTKNRPSFLLKSVDYELAEIKQTIEEKNVIIDNHNGRIHELENYLSDLREECVTLRNELDNFNSSENAKLEGESKKLKDYDQMVEVVGNYEKFIKRMYVDYEVIKKEKGEVASSLGSMGTKFSDLSQKYERLKEIANAYKQNQEYLLKCINLYKNAMSEMDEGYNNFKAHTNEVLDQGNDCYMKVGENYKREIAQAKSEILENEAKIKELEKTILNMSINSKLSNAESTEPDITQSMVYAFEK